MRVLHHRLLTTRDLSAPELAAAVLDGTCYRVGQCWASIAEPECAGLRAEAFLEAVPDRRLIASGATAAWIWGALAVAPSPTEASVAPGRRLRYPGNAVRVRELLLSPSDLAPVGAAVATTPLRTATDLLRGPGQFTGAQQTAIVGLLAMHLDRATIADQLHRMRHLPGTRTALQRLDRLTVATTNGLKHSAARRRT